MLSYMYSTYIGLLHVKCRLLLSDCNETSIVSTDFRKIVVLNFMKIRPVGAELLHADRQTDGQPANQTDRPDQANSRLSQCCERT